MDPKLSLAQTLKADLARSPKALLEIDTVWKRLLRLYPKINFKKIKTQQQWDDIYHEITIRERDRKLFPEKAFNHSLFWLEGPISQDPDMQEVIATIRPAKKTEIEKGKKDDSHKDSYSFSKKLKDEDGKDEGENKESPEGEMGSKEELQATPPAQVATETPAIAKAQIASTPPLITTTPQTSAPINKIPGVLKGQGQEPRGITTLTEARQPKVSGEIIAPNQQTLSPSEPLIIKPSAITTGPIISSPKFFNPTGDLILPRISSRDSSYVDSGSEPESTPGESAGSQPPPPSQSRAPSRPSPAQNSNQSPPTPSNQRQRGRAKALGQRMLSSKFGGAAKIVRAAGLISAGWWVAIIVGAIVAVIILKPEPPDVEEYHATISIETVDTKVRNVIGDVFGISTSTTPTPPFEKKAVLGITEDLLNRGKQALQKGIGFIDDLTELAKRHKDSLVTYTITASYNGPAREVEVVYPIPKDAMLINASGVFKTETGRDELTGVEKVTKITWLFSENDGSSRSASTTNVPTTKGISYEKYTQSPYFLPPPSGGSVTTYSQSTIDALNRLGSAITQNSSYLQSKFSSQYVDPFLSVIWVGAIEGIGDQPYFWNCKDVRSITINDGCPGGYYSGGWQVGYGVQVAQVSGHLAADFDSIYGPGASGNASKVKDVGQAVISGSGGKITNPSSFPQETIASLIGKADSGNQAAQQAIAILLMDQKLGATAIALEVAGDIRSQNNWAGTMKSWGSYYVNNMQTFSNRAKALADQYSGTSNAREGNAGSSFGTKIFAVTVLPLKPDIILDSGQATINVDEIAGSRPKTASDSADTTSGGGATSTGHVPPTTNTCGGTYSLSSNPAGKNYGDPVCSYNKNKLYDLLKKMDPVNADLWFNKVIPCESAYDPNTYYRCGAQGCTPDPNGAWGLFQMGRGVDGPFINLNRGSTNNSNRPEDRGDVNWELQVSNAVNFGKKYLTPYGTPLGAYWACAR